MLSVKPRRQKFALLLLLAAAPHVSADVALSVQEKAQRVDVTVDGRPFTSYLYGGGLKKPVLFPLHTDRGLVITRGYPLEPRPGERVDHPHHVGLWLNHGAVNGVDFWNNGDHDRSAAMGVIEHRAVRKADGGERGVLDVEMEWVMPGGRPVLREETRFVFGKSGHTRRIDRITTLTALDDRVVLGDTKEGLLGLRVARFLEHPEGKAVALIDASGAPGPAVLDEAGVNGRYYTSEGKSGGDAWGTRGRWAALEGRHAGEWVTVALLDHPRNPGHPTYWHARGYGLFAANPIGQRSFVPTEPAREIALAKGENARFAYRVLIVSKKRGPRDIEKEYARFTREVD